MTMAKKLKLKDDPSAQVIVDTGAKRIEVLALEEFSKLVAYPGAGTEAFVEGNLGQGEDLPDKVAAVKAAFVEQAEALFDEKVKGAQKEEEAGVPYRAKAGDEPSDKQIQGA